MTYRNFERDTYSDGSWDVFQTDDHVLGNWVGTYDAPETKAGLIHVVKNITTPTYVEVKETESNGHVFTGSVGVQVDSFGVSGSASVMPESSTSTTVRITFFPPDKAEHRWTYGYKSGANTTGFIGMVWQDY
jgi:hypothetical protein